MKKNKLIILVFLQIFAITSIFLIGSSSTLNYPPPLANNHESSTISTSGIPVLWWDYNGTLISNASNNQESPQICSDSAGGAIITWTDWRAGPANRDIYAQKINSTGSVQWTVNGVAICTAIGIQEKPQMCSDGNGGAIITWVDKRSGIHIYAQKINSTGSVQWTANGVAICTASSTRQKLQICYDGLGGAIITWEDWRYNNWDIYAQKINATGSIQWIANGKAICTEITTQGAPQICSNGSGGAIITWIDARDLNWDIYAQKINATGSIQWMANGTAICTESNNQNQPQISSDGSGAIITWRDYRSGLTDIYAQRINSTGSVRWTANGTTICTAGEDQQTPQICSDGEEGAIISWRDNRSGNFDIYAQRIDSNGAINWTNNGTAICTESATQGAHQICSDGNGGAIITWVDERSGVDIYAQLVNSAGEFQWMAGGAAVCTADNYQNLPKISNDGSGGAIIAWEDNRSGSNSDIYAQKIIDDIFPPTSNQPPDTIAFINGTETINWILHDDVKSGQYRVWVNDTNDNYYLWIDWTSWINATSLSVPINRTALGVYNYTIEYKDSGNRFGIPDTIIVTIEEKPTSNQPDDITTSMSGSETISWVLIDESGGGKYQVLINGSIWVNWTDWTNNTWIIIPIYRGSTGIYIYTIEYYDNHNNFGISDTVTITITSDTPIPEQPESPINVIAPQDSGDISSFLLSTLGLGIVAGFGVLLLIIVVLVLKNNREIKEIREFKKISKTPTSKKSFEK